MPESHLSGSLPYDVLPRGVSRALAQSVENVIAYEDWDDVERSKFMEKVLMKLCGGAWATISRSVHLFPLKFADSVAEKDHAKLTRTIYRTRGVMVACVNAFILLFFHISFCVFWQFHRLVRPRNTIVSTLHVMSVMVLLLHISYALVRWIPWIRERAELCLHFLLACDLPLYFVWAGSYLRRLDIDDLITDRDAEVAHLQTRIWLEWTVHARITYVSVALNFFLPSRTAETFWLLIVLISSLWVARVIANVQVERSLLTDARRSHAS
eukprot:Blabericola_migrator_1__2617@NODE_173_length_12074_cov_75_040476_g150_i0_p5_GENE_NODE_173_length_12074_cov_75_040476_g150_i0NODE_173_length_12074_cov_75_040476_g150_i0_p5_ORF_typecomplete_len268_score19_73CTP_transf_1/PF01148_20/0_36_NODE_173_length_12074_cov_75_040476_g150_i072468049